MTDKCPVQDESSLAAQPPAALPLQENSAGECVVLARQLTRLLEEENEALRCFAGARLVQLLSDKQRLITDLADRLEAFKATGVPKNASEMQGDCPLLRQLLGEIEEKNQKNALFIQGTLAFYQDFFCSVVPTVYAPDGERIPGREPPKGLKLSKEV